MERINFHKSACSKIYRAFAPCLYVYEWPCNTSIYRVVKVARIYDNHKNIIIIVAHFEFVFKIINGY
jgi:hypothetical protein